MEQKDKKLTIWIIIIAAVLLISCFCLSACAAGLYFFTKIDTESMIGNFFNRNNDAAKEEAITVTPESASETEIPSDGNLLTPAQQKIIETAQKIRGTIGQK